MSPADSFCSDPLIVSIVHVYALITSQKTLMTSRIAGKNLKFSKICLFSITGLHSGTGPDLEVFGFFCFFDDFR